MLSSVIHPGYEGDDISEKIHNPRCVFFLQ